MFIQLTVDALTSTAGNTHGLVFEATGLGVFHGGSVGHCSLIERQPVDVAAVVCGMMTTAREAIRGDSLEENTAADI